MPTFIDRTGQRFGRLTVLSLRNRASRVPLRRTTWTCQCDCGTVVDVEAGKLASGHTQSCGCYMRERASQANLRHGQSSHPNGGNATKEYNTWMLMLRRCHKVGSQDYAQYGGRGITVCERWHTFDLFFSDMGAAPSPSHSIERLDNERGYEPGNCKWATPKEQRRNQRRAVLIEFAGKSQTPMEWATETGISHKRIHARMKILGWSVEKTLTTPVR